MKNERNDKAEVIFKPVRARIIIVSFIVIALLPPIYKLCSIPSDPDLRFLVPQGHAKWIHVGRPFALDVRTGSETVRYRKYFKVENAPPRAVLSISAMRSASVTLDGQIILPYNSLEEWKSARSVDISGLLTPGEHELEISVYNENGPAVVLAYCRELNLFTGADWEAWHSFNWAPAVPANKTKTLELAQLFPSTFQAFYSLSVFYLAVFVIVFLLTIFPHSPRSPSWTEKTRVGPAAVRWVLMGLWALLAVNNITKIPLLVGYDSKEHYEYIAYVADKWTIPLATQGWQMFQSPLYYFISAALKVFLSLFFNETMAAMLLRAIPLFCGALQIELSYRAVQYVFPERKDLQIMGTIIGGLLPMNIYISQSVGNEPLAGVFSAVVLVTGLSLIRSESLRNHGKRWLFLGVALGLSLLTKMTAILLVPALLFLIFNVSFIQKRLRENMAGGSVAVSAALIISGWYYLRNWIKMGKPFIGGWESSLWWQDPGYRTADDLLSFGASLLHPIYAAIYGFWNSIYSTLWLDGSISSITMYSYRPPWNYNFMISGSLLALLPTAGILIGMIEIFSRPLKALKEGKLFCAYCVCVYFAALLYLYISLPIYSTAKATYTLGLLPCYAVICVSGLNVLTRNIISRGLVNAVLSCWAVSAYLSYFVL